jgi:membrane-bound metal-dependent hydrolase YbcI (DUF457 family)
VEVRQHVRMGVVWGLAGCAFGAQLMGITWAADVLIAPAIVGGAGEWNDIDHHGATVTRAFPPVTFPLHMIVVWINRILYTLTRRGHDPPAWNGYFQAGRFRTSLCSYLPQGLWFLVGRKRMWRSAHRGFTHSVFTAIFVGLVIGYMCSAGPWWISVIIFVTTVGLAGDLVFAGPVLALYVVTGAIHFGVAGLADHLVDMGWLWGTCVALGMLSHDFADTCTTAGLAFLSPLTWEEFYSPLPFDTGGFFEKVVVKWILIFMMIALAYAVMLQWLPSVFPHGIPFLQDLLRSLVSGFSRS